MESVIPIAMLAVILLLVVGTTAFLMIQTNNVLAQRLRAVEASSRRFRIIASRKDSFMHESTEIANRHQKVEGATQARVASARGGRYNHENPLVFRPGSDGNRFSLGPFVAEAPPVLSGVRPVLRVVDARMEFENELRIAQEEFVLACQAYDTARTVFPNSFMVLNFLARPFPPLDDRMELSIVHALGAENGTVNGRSTITPGMKSAGNRLD